MARFRLARVLAYRRIQVQSLEQELHQRRHKLQQEETALAGLQTVCRQQQAALIASEGQRLAGEALQMWHRHYRTLEAQVQRQHEAVLEAARAVAVTQQEVIAARQKKKMLEKMAATVQQRHIMRVARDEQQLLDEIANMRSSDGYQTSPRD
jgi:flagellar export protein FliJ